MQELYYTPASASLTLVKDDNNLVKWSNITNLIVCSSRYEIVVVSGSTTVAEFPIEGTNLYYAPFTVPTPSSPIPPPVNVSASLSWAVYFTQNDLTPSFMSGSWCLVYSGSNYYVSQSRISNGGNSVLNPNKPYTVVVSGSNTSETYDTHIYLFDTTNGTTPAGDPGILIYSASTSNNLTTTVFTPTTGSSYLLNMALVGSTFLL